MFDKQNKKLSKASNNTIFQRQVQRSQSKLLRSGISIFKLRFNAIKKMLNNCIFNFLALGRKCKRKP